MSSEIIISVGPLRTWCALMTGEHLENLLVEDRHRPTDIGAIYLGRVRRVNHRLNAAFVDIGAERDGFLPLFADGPELHEGEAIMVQVNRDGGADKGARLSRELSIAGHNLVYVPDSDRMMISRRIENEDRRAHLVALMEDMKEDFDGGFIVRTAAAEAADEDLEDEADYLADKWEEAEDAAEGADAPACLLPADELAVRALQDWLDPTIGAIRCDDRATLARLTEACEQWAPWAVERLELAPEGQSLMETSGLVDEVELLSEPRAELASGGWLAIQPTQALVAIDVNSGTDQRGARRGERDRDRGPGPLDTNLEAAEEVARQLRLRDLGGLIVIDFLRLKNDDAMARVVERLRGALAADRAHTRVSGPSEFGLVEVQRRRSQEEAAELWTRACPACDGGGRMVAPAMMADRILARLAAQVRAEGGRHWRIAAAPSVIKLIDRVAEEVGDRLQVDLSLDGESGRAADRFEISPA